MQPACTKRQSIKGFTLVELAIVMTIIGLLIGGVLKGQEMIRNAQITASVAQIKSVQAAMESFHDRFDQMPGDMSAATTRLTGCSTATFCYDGNGDSRIGGTAASIVQQNQSGVNTLPAVETTMFWKHMAMADLIAGVNQSANPTTPAWGQTHPSSPIRGGLLVATKATGEPNAFPSGILLMHRLSPTEYTYPLTPAEGVQLDRKMDDGMPNAGFVAAENVGSGCKTNDGATGQYNETDVRRICMLYFRLR